MFSLQMLVPRQVHASPCCNTKAPKIFWLCKTSCQKHESLILQSYHPVTCLQDKKKCFICSTILCLFQVPWNLFVYGTMWIIVPEIYPELSRNTRLVCAGPCAPSMFCWQANACFFFVCLFDNLENAKRNVELYSTYAMTLVGHQNIV